MTDYTFSNEGWALLSGEIQQLFVTQTVPQQESWFDAVVSSKKSQDELVEMLNNTVL